MPCLQALGIVLKHTINMNVHKLIKLFVFSSQNRPE